MGEAPDSAPFPSRYVGLRCGAGLGRIRLCPSESLFSPQSNNLTKQELLMLAYRYPNIWATFAVRLVCGLSLLAVPVLAQQKSPTIAFLMPCSTCADRFEGQDKPLFIEAVRKLDPAAKVIANNAQGSTEAQISQAEASLTNGASVIVVSPFTEAAGAAIVDKAKAQNVPVVSYDGL